MNESHEKTPRRVGRYEVAGRITRRPFEDGSDVLLALDALRTGASKVVVVKRLSPSLTTSAPAVDEYLGVANRVSKKLHHPNVVEIRAAAREGDDVFLVMDYMLGETLASVTQRLSDRGENLDPATAAYIISEACGGLYAAKAAELVHGCLTPYDVFIGYDGAVRVLDIGTAAAKTQLAGGQLRDLELLYTSPDRVYNETVDRKSDVFSMGAILYELLAGFSPFEASDRADTTRAICDEPIPPPIAVAPKAPQEMSDVVMSALTRDRGKRPDEIALRKLLSPSIGTSARRELEVLMARLFEKRVKDKKELLHKLANKSGNESVDLTSFDFEDRLYPTSVRVQPAMVPPAIELESSPVEPLTAPAIEAEPPPKAEEPAPFLGEEAAPAVGEAPPAPAPPEVEAPPPAPAPIVAAEQPPASDRVEARPISSPRAAVASTRMLAAEPVTEAEPVAAIVPTENAAPPAPAEPDAKEAGADDAASTKQLAAARASASVPIVPVAPAQPDAAADAAPEQPAAHADAGADDAASTKELAAARASANVPLAPESSARPLVVEPEVPVDRASARAFEVNAEPRAPRHTQPLGGLPTQPLGTDLAAAAPASTKEPVAEEPVAAVAPEPAPSRPRRATQGMKSGPNISVRSMLFFAGIGAVVVVAIVVFQSGPKTNDTPTTPSTASSTPAAPASSAPELPSSPSTKITTPAKSSAPASSSSPKKEETVIIIDTVPAHATILVGGTKMGMSPYELKVAKSSTPMMVEIRHPGYVTMKERVVPNTNQRLKLTLTAAKAAPTTSSPYRRIE